MLGSELPISNSDLCGTGKGGVVGKELHFVLLEIVEVNAIQFLDVSIPTLLHSPATFNNNTDYRGTPHSPIT